MPFCGKKLSICCTIMSIWAIIMLSIMGGLLYVKSVAFAEDLEAETLEDMDKAYEGAAQNCWVAVGLYGVTLLVSAHQFYLNMKMEAM